MTSEVKYLACNSKKNPVNHKMSERIEASAGSLRGLGGSLDADKCS